MLMGCPSMCMNTRLSKQRQTNIVKGYEPNSYSWEHRCPTNDVWTPLKLGQPIGLDLNIMLILSQILVNDKFVFSLISYFYLPRKLTQNSSKIRWSISFDFLHVAVIHKNEDQIKRTKYYHSAHPQDSLQATLNFLDWHDYPTTLNETVLILSSSEA